LAVRAFLTAFFSAAAFRVEDFFQDAARRFKVKKFEQQPTAQNRIRGLLWSDG
jgi:hypothetical protein